MEISTLLIIGIIILTTTLLLTLFALVIYSGLVYNIEISAGSPPIKNFKAVYKYGQGPYKDTGAVFCDVVSIAPKAKTFGVYYDDPKVVRAAWKKVVILIF